MKIRFRDYMGSDLVWSTLLPSMEDQEAYPVQYPLGQLYRRSIANKLDPEQFPLLASHELTTLGVSPSHLTLMERVIEASQRAMDLATCLENPYLFRPICCIAPYCFFDPTDLLTQRRMEIMRFNKGEIAMIAYIYRNRFGAR